eukprot:2609679-Heterocapsa_arctica.AAC.1
MLNNRDHEGVVGRGQREAAHVPDMLPFMASLVREPTRIPKGDGDIPKAKLVRKLHPKSHPVTPPCEGTLQYLACSLAKERDATRLLVHSDPDGPGTGSPRGVDL